MFVGNITGLFSIIFMYTGLSLIGTMPFGLKLFCVAYNCKKSILPILASSSYVGVAVISKGISLLVVHSGMPEGSS